METILYPQVKIKDVLSAFWKGMKPHRGIIFLILITSLLANIGVIIVPIFYKKFFDILATSETSYIIIQKLILILFYILILNFICWIFFRIADFSFAYFQANVIATLKQQAYNYMMGHSYSFFINNFSGSLVQKINRFAKAFETVTDDIFFSIFPLFIRVASVFLILLILNKWIAFLILFWVLISCGFTILFSQWKLKYDIQSAQKDSETTAFLADTIGNYNTIQLFNGFNFEKKNFKRITDEQARIKKIAWSLDSLLWGIQTMFSILIEFFLFFWAVKFWERSLVTVGFFVMIQAYVINIISQIWVFPRLIRDIYQSYADSKEMVEILKLPYEIEDKPLVKELKVEKGEIQFKDVSFNFKGTREVLKDINLIIKPGEKVALVGPSGAGKTTLVRLLLRLYSPAKGQILIDGQDISQVTQESLRKNIALVPQEPLLFHRTLAENIAYGKKEATREEIERASSLARCDDFIKILPLGFDTYVGEKGIKLSGGERQRVAIARAILKNAPILILDEATSSLDSRSEKLIQEALDFLMQGRTTIVIAHRLSTIKKMDRIIVIDKGRIVEQGTHRELLSRKDSLYKNLWKLQTEGFFKGQDQKTEEETESEDSEEGFNEDGFSRVKMISF